MYTFECYSLLRLWMNYLKTCVFIAWHKNYCTRNLHIIGIRHHIMTYICTKDTYVSIQYRLKTGIYIICNYISLNQSLQTPTLVNCYHYLEAISPSEYNLIVRIVNIFPIALTRKKPLWNRPLLPPSLASPHLTIRPKYLPASHLTTQAWLPLTLPCVIFIWLPLTFPWAIYICLPLAFQQATGLDAWASRVKCPARFVSHLHEICIYIWVVYSLCFFCCLFITVTWWYVWRIEWASGNQEEVQACLVTLWLFIISCYSLYKTTLGLLCSWFENNPHFHKYSMHFHV